MATFDLARQNLLMAATSFDLAIMTADTTLESAIDDVGIFLEEAQFKVLNEGGTDEDMAYYKEQASEGFIATAKEVILKIIESIKEFFSELKEKAIKLFAAKDIDSNIEKVEKKIKFNPFLKNKKVKINDSEAKVNAIREHKSNLGKMLAKISGGEKVTSEEVDKENERFNKAWIAASAATVTVAFAAILETIRRERAKLSDKIAKCEDELMERVKKAKEKVEKCTDPEQAASFTKLCSSIAKAAKKEGDTILNGLLDKWKSLKNAVSRSRDSDEDVFDESVNPFEDDILDDDDIGEGDIDDFVSAFAAASGVGEENEYPVDDVDADDADVDVPVYAGEIDESNENDINKLVDDTVKDATKDKAFKIDETTTTDENAEDDVSLEAVAAEMNDLFAGLAEFYSESKGDCCTECGKSIAEGSNCYATEGGQLVCEECWNSKNNA